MLEELKVLNGELWPKFDKYNNLYTVFIDSDVDKLELSYIVSEGKIDKIVGNYDLKPGENKVILYLNNNKAYELNVIKKEIEKTASILDNYEKVEQKEVIPTYVAPLLSIICFILILFSYLLIFKKKNNK